MGRQTPSADRKRPSHGEAKATIWGTPTTCANIAQYAGGGFAVPWQPVRLSRVEGQPRPDRFGIVCTIIAVWRIQRRDLSPRTTSIGYGGSMVTRYEEHIVVTLFQVISGIGGAYIIGFICNTERQPEHRQRHHRVELQELASLHRLQMRANHLPYLCLFRGPALKVVRVEVATPDG